MIIARSVRQLEMDAGKVCRQCSALKPEDDFHRDKRYADGRSTQCKECHRAYVKKWRDENRDRYNQAARRWVEANREKTTAADRRYKDAHPEKRRKDHLKRYGLTIEQYEEMFDRQGGRCAACGQPEYKVRRSMDGKLYQLMVDHCHETGRVRALLCSSCNTALGMLEDSADRIACLLIYAEEQCR